MRRRATTVRFVVDADGRTNSYYYIPTNLYQLQRTVDAWGRTNSLTYAPGAQEGLLPGSPTGRD